MTNILIALVLILLVATLVQILRVSELLSELKKQDVNEVTDKDNAIQGKILLIVGTLFLGSAICKLDSVNVAAS